jgi:ring-1,2-phenylacetyl-CoA epoxidase subunit PaaD
VSDAAAMPIKSPATLELARQLIANLPDPEIPAVTLEDLGILREVFFESESVVVTLTPTYSGCPATEAIRSDVISTLLAAGFIQPKVRIVLSPPWSTDWITDVGRNKLRDYGIAPPLKAVANACSLGLELSTPSDSVLIFKAPSKGIQCPRCSSNNTERLSQFGSTPCKALYRCVACREPFDYFKPF